MSAPTINDVARVAGVGKTSVSRYLNGEMAALSPALKARIEEAIAALAYRPSQMARGLKRGRTRLIGILVADLQNPFSVALMQGIENACRESGLMPMICNAGNQVEVESRYLDLMQTYRAEGVIVNPVGILDSALQAIAEGGLPMVMLDRTVEGIACDTIGLNNTAASHTIVDHLVEAGFTSLYFVSEEIASVSSRRQREAAFTERAAYHGVEARTLVVDLADPGSIERVIDTLHGAGSASSEDDVVTNDDAKSTGAARMAATSVRTSACTSAKPTALLSANGQTMLAVASALTARPLPGLGLATFDDPEWIKLASPGITSLRQPTFQMGETAVQLLNERIKDHIAQTHRPVREVSFDATLLVRGSTVGKTR